MVKGPACIQPEAGKVLVDAGRYAAGSLVRFGLLKLVQARVGWSIRHWLEEVGLKPV